MPNPSDPTTVIAVAATAFVVAAAGGATVASSHPVTDHQPSQSPTTQAYTGTAVPGPHDPDGPLGPAPYTYGWRAPSVTECQTAGAGTCHVGGPTWDACESPDHARNGGTPIDDIPCSGPTQTPYDHVDADLDCQTCGVAPRPVPLMLATDSGDADSVHGEGVGGNPGNDGLGPFDGGPGPREIEEGFCTQVQGLTRPNPVNPTFGTGDGVVSQAGESYKTHHLGASSTTVGPGDVTRPHPGVHSLTVFVLGPVHGSLACENPSPVPAEQGAINLVLN